MFNHNFKRSIKKKRSKNVDLNPKAPFTISGSVQSIKYLYKNIMITMKVHSANHKIFLSVLEDHPFHINISLNEKIRAHTILQIRRYLALKKSYLFLVCL